MNCDECKEQVFELIEREAVDPDGVREILSRCPDCRVAFDEMKAALAVTEQLPIEEPPPALDGAVVRAARDRAPRAVPLRKRRLQPAPWAMAAIALLAVGVGVWTIPRKVQLESDAAPGELKNAGEIAMADQVLEEETKTSDSRDAVAQLGSEGTAALRAPETAEPEPKKGSRAPVRARRRARSSPDEESVARLAQPPAAAPAADMAVAGAAESRSHEAAAKASAPPKQGKQEKDDDATCRRKVDDFERRAGTDDDYAPTPEEELAIGKCYQTLDNVADARKWLQRAAAHRKTKGRAEAALRELAAE